MSALEKTSVLWRGIAITVRITVDADIAFNHPRVRGAEVDLVTAIELLELQWKRDHEAQD
jgi:hypothetical protein